MNQIGSVLKEAREKKGLTIDDIQAETKIQKRYLVHIEASELDKLPGNFYAKAFVKQYAEAVGVNSSEILSMYKTEFPEDKRDESAYDMYNRAHKMNNEEDFKGRLVDNLPKLMVICFVVISLIAAYMFIMSDSENSGGDAVTKEQEEITFVEPGEEQEPNVKEPVEDQTAEEKPAETEAPPAETKTSVVPVSKDGDTSVYNLTNAPAGDFKVTLTATADCWFEIVDESTGESLYNGVVKPGTPVDVTVPAASTEFSISIGNTGGGKVAVNGVEVVYQIPPASGQLQTLVVKPVAAPAQ